MTTTDIFRLIVELAGCIYLSWLPIRFLRHVDAKIDKERGVRRNG